MNASALVIIFSCLCLFLTQDEVRADGFSMIGISKLRMPCGTRGFSRCDDLTSKVTAIVNEQVDKHLEAAYKGHYLDPRGDEDSPYFKNLSIQIPVCNFFENEKDKNKNGQSCGTKCAFRCVTRTVKTKKITECSVDQKTCQRERAWLRGALFQLVRVKADEVLTQFKATKEVDLSGRCAGPAEDSRVGYLGKALSENLDKWLEVSKGRNPECKETAENEEPLPDQEAACYLHGAKTMLEGLISYSLICEIFSQAEQQWLAIEKGNFENRPAGAANLALKSQKCLRKMDESADAFAKCIKQEYDQLIEREYSGDILVIKTKKGNKLAK